MVIGNACAVGRRASIALPRRSDISDLTIRWQRGSSHHPKEK
jgi:hypothetical protein